MSGSIVFTYWFVAGLGAVLGGGVGFALVLAVYRRFGLVGR